MAARVLPAPDRFAACPLDGRILEYYAGVFEAAYVLLHPFIKAVSIGRELFAPFTYPKRTAIAKNCTSVSWEEVARMAGLPSIAAVDIGLRSGILGLRSDLSNQDYAARIDSLFESESIVPPPEGAFSDLLHDRIRSAIQSVGQEWVWVGDEFGTERKLRWIDDLKEQDAGPTRGHCNVFTPDKALLWTTHFDSHFSFLCSSRSTLEAIQDAYAFEGFYCKPETEVYWSVLP